MPPPSPAARSARPVIIRTIDAHAEGTPVRLIVEGFPSPVGAHMGAKRDWAARHSDHLRQSLMLEPRGHIDMCGAVLTEPVAPGSHAGVLFLDNHGYGELSSHALIAVTTIALERGLLLPGGDGATIVFDTTAGMARARAVLSIESAGGDEAPRRVVERVAVAGAPSFVLHGGVAIRLGARQIRADIAFGGEIRKALRVAASIPTLPATVVMASTDTSGEARARRMASASSIPGSVSISIGRVI
jgi:proline racemase